METNWCVSALISQTNLSEKSKQITFFDEFHSPQRLNYITFVILITFQTQGILIGK